MAQWQRWLNASVLKTESRKRLVGSNPTCVAKGMKNMSRSYKKYPQWKIERSCKIGKLIANNKVRNYLKSGKEIPDGKSYRKLFDSWNICDCRSSKSFKDWKQRYGDNKYEWYKIYKMK